MIRTRRMDDEFSVTHALAADETETVRPGLNIVDRVLGTLIGVQIDYIATDRRKRSGAAIDTVRFKAIPKQQHDLMGGNTWHTFAAVDSEQQNLVRFGSGIVLRPGEDLVLTVNNGTAASTVVYRVGRTLIFDDGQAPPALAV